LIEPEAIVEAAEGFKKTTSAAAPEAKGKAGTFESLPDGLKAQIASTYLGQDRSATAMSVYAQLWHLGWSQDAVKTVVLAHPHGFYTHYKKDTHLDKDIARCFEKFEAEDERDANEATPADDLPIIKVKAGRLSILATKAEELLIAAEVPIYQRAGVLVRPIIEAVDASHGRKTKIATLKGYDTVYVRDMLGRHASWVKSGKDKDPISGKKKTAPIDPPKEVACTILARVGDWTFPSIAGVISTPRPDGSLLEQGFDEATRLLLIEPPPMPPIPDNPTKDDALAALKSIEDLLTGFPFVGGDDGVAKAVALSGFLTPIVRGAFPVSPLHASRAPTAGSGKSYLWDIVASAAAGQLMPVTSAGAGTEELEKRLGTFLMRGQPLINIDNISGELGGDFLCQAIERPVVDVRVLGRSEAVRCEARGTTLYATGNNFVVVGDVCRRVITCNLDAEMERPELRQFKFDPVERVLSDRGKYIAAALTICRAYVVDGERQGRRPERLELSDMMEAWAEAIGIGSGSRVKLSAVLDKGAAMSRPHEGADLEPDLIFAPLLRTFTEGAPARPVCQMAGCLGNGFRGSEAG
jgi:putative DNA primase/helicase